MAEKYLFFNSTIDDRRKHKASDIAEYWDSFLKSGLIHTDGKPTLKVEANGSDMEISVDLGKAVILGHLYINDSSLKKPISQSTASEDRFDRVVLRLDLNIENRYIKVFIKEGTALAPPELTREGNIYEVSLAQIHVKQGKSFLEQSDIIDERLDEELCGLASSLVTVPTDIYAKEWKEFVAEYNKWFTEIQNATYATVEDVRKSENNIKREVANLNLQLEASKRVKNGVTFGTNFADSFGMEVDMARTSSDEALSIGQTVITVQDASEFTPGAEVTIFDDVNLERVNIASIDGNVITLESALAKGFKEGVNIARSMGKPLSTNSMAFGVWGSYKDRIINLSITPGSIDAVNFEKINDDIVYSSDRNGHIVAMDPFGDTKIVENYSYTGAITSNTSVGKFPIFDGRKLYILTTSSLAEDRNKLFVTSYNKKYEKIDEKNYTITNAPNAIGKACIVGGWIIFMKQSSGTPLREAIFINDGLPGNQVISGSTVTSDNSPGLPHYIRPNGDIVLHASSSGNFLYADRFDGQSFVRDDSLKITSPNEYQVKCMSSFVNKDGDIYVALGTRTSTTVSEPAKLVTLLKTSNHGETYEKVWESLVPGFNNIYLNNKLDIYVYDGSYNKEKTIRKKPFNEVTFTETIEMTFAYDRPNNAVFMKDTEFEGKVPLLMVKKDSTAHAFYGDGVFGYGDNIKINDIRFKTKPSKELVTWIQHDEGLTVDEVKTGNVYADLYTIDNETQAVGVSTQEFDETRVTISRASVDDDVKITRILGGTE